MKTVLFIVTLLLLSGNAAAQPFFYLTNTPANGDYYVPGDTITAIFTIKEDGELSGMRVTAKDSTKSISDLQPQLTLTDHYPPVKEHQLAIMIPDNFRSKDTLFVFEVTATIYGKYTLEFKLKSMPANISQVNEHSSLLIYPNPSTKLVTIASSFLTRDARVTLISVNGKQSIFSADDVTKDELPMDISSLAKGEYIINVTCPTGSAKGKLIVR